MQIGTKNLLALCHIIGEYPKFRNEIKPILEKNSTNILLKLCRQEMVIGKRKEKRIYQNIKDAFNTIIRYSNIYCFTRKLKEIDNYYNYLIAHKNDLETIVTVVNKLNELGIKQIIFDPSIDFTKENYKFSITSDDCLQDVYFVDNIKIIPNYQDDVIRYGTTNSSYKINIIWKEITLNTLIFDIKTLPKDLSEEETLNKIINLNDLMVNENNQVRSSVDLRVGINDLEELLKELEHNFNYNSLLTSKTELQKALLNTKKVLLELKKESEKYISDITKDNGIINQDLIEEERHAYLNRRSIARLDID